MVSKSDTGLIVSPLSDHSLAMSSPGNTLQTSRQSRKVISNTTFNDSVSESHVNGTFGLFNAHQNQQHTFNNITQQQQMNIVTGLIADLQRAHAQQQQQRQIQLQEDWFFKALNGSIEPQLQGSFNQNNLLSSSPTQNQISTVYFLLNN